VSPSTELTADPGVFADWRASLARLLAGFDTLRARTGAFYKKLFAVFIGLNMACFWWALLTAYPEKMLSYEAREIALMSVPVSLFGGLFDFLSLFITLYIARRALATSSNRVFVAYLSIDLVIAIVAAAWVLFMFTVSGWLVNLALSLPETLGQRESLYQQRFWAALLNPLHPESVRNIYFGIVMGASATLPTMIHLYHAMRGMVRAVFMPAARHNRG
jgi:hypothetical protein